VGNYGKRYVTFTDGFWSLYVLDFCSFVFVDSYVLCSRYDFYLNDPTCTNLDVSMDITGWAAAYMGAASPVAGATPVDLQVGDRFVHPTSFFGFKFLNDVRSLEICVPSTVLTHEYSFYRSRRLAVRPCSSIMSDATLATSTVPVLVLRL
jgi:hypothetical protein